MLRFCSLLTRCTYLSSFTGQRCQKAKLAPNCQYLDWILVFLAPGLHLSLDLLGQWMNNPAKLGEHLAFKERCKIEMQNQDQVEIEGGPAHLSPACMAFLWCVTTGQRWKKLQKCRRVGNLVHKCWRMQPAGRGALCTGTNKLLSWLAMHCKVQLAIDCSAVHWPWPWRSGCYVLHLLMDSLPACPLHPPSPPLTLNFFPRPPGPPCHPMQLTLGAAFIVAFINNWGTPKKCFLDRVATGKDRFPNSWQWWLPLNG